jgi:hypothetical protein
MRPRMGAVVIISLAIKLVSLVIVLYAFKALSVDESGKFGVYTRLLMMKRKYDLLRMSLLFIAVILLLELFSMSYTLVMEPQALNMIQVIISDAVFIGLILLISRIYISRNSLKRI